MFLKRRKKHFTKYCVIHSTYILTFKNNGYDKFKERWSHMIMSKIIRSWANT